MSDKMTEWEFKIAANYNPRLNKFKFLRDEGPSSVPFDLKGHLQSLIITNEKVIEQLLLVLASIEDGKEVNKALRTTGVVFGATGTAAMIGGLFLAPFTGGLSLFGSALSVGGLVGTGASGLFAFGSHIDHKKRTKGFYNKLETLRSIQNNASKKVNDDLKIVEQVIKKLKTEMSEEQAEVAVFSSLNKSCFTDLKTVNGSLSPEQVVKIVRQIMDAISDFKLLIGSLSSLSLVSRSSFSIVNSGMGATSEVVGAIKASRSLAPTAVSTTSKVVVRGIGASIGVVVTVIDITLLVLNWDKPHPLEKTIHSLIKELRTDVEKCTEILALINALNPKSS